VSAIDCNVYPDLFFATKPGLVARAKKLCAGCPIQTECQEWGRTEEYGVWGGTSARDRRRTQAGGTNGPTLSDRLDAQILTARNRKQRVA